jgi:hypothetical protein
MNPELNQKIKTRFLLILVMLGILFPGVTVPSHAQTVTVPHTFVTGNDARADQVNENFNALAGAINGIKTGTTVLGYLAVAPQLERVEGGEIQLQGASGSPPVHIDNFEGHARIFSLAPGKTLQVLGGDGIVANYLRVAPQLELASEGGEILLMGANGYNAIAIDNAGGNARIFWLQPGKALHILGGDGVVATAFTPSDIRLKKDIHPVSEVDALEDIMHLNPVSYRWKETEKRGDNIHFGFIAQEVEKIVPEVIRGEGDDIKGINYDGVIALLTRAVQEQQKEIEALKVRLEGLGQ